MYYVYEWYRMDFNLPYYIGKGSGNRAYNLQRYKRTNDTTNYLLKNGIKRDVRIIAYFSNEDNALEYEKERIAFWWYLKDHNILTNQTLGGTGLSKGFKHSLETREKMSKTQKVIQNRPEIKEFNRIRMLGNTSRTGMKTPEETKAKQKITLKLVNNTPEYKLKQSIQSKIMHTDPDFKEKHRKGCKESANRPEIKYNKLRGGDHGMARSVIELDEIKIFPTMKEAGEYYGVKNVYEVCRGKQKTTKGHKFMYLDKYNNKVDR